MIVPQKIFSVIARLSKVGLDSRPVTLASIQVDNHEKCYQVCDRPLKKFFSRDARLSKKWVSRQSPRDLASIQVDNHEKCYDGMWSSLKKIFSVTLASQTIWVSRQSPRDTRLYSSW